MTRSRTLIGLCTVTLIGASAFDAAAKQAAPPRSAQQAVPAPPRSAAGQTAPPRSGADATAAAIGRGWTALASGGADAAVKAADEVLGRQPGHHGALELKIEAMKARPLPALDVYEQWLVTFRTEDPFLLTPIARGTLAEIASGSDPALQAQALERLARSGDADADTRLRALPAAATSALDVQRALDGDATAATRLLDPARAATVPATTLAQALSAAGPAATATLRALLKHPAAPVRAAAAIALGKSGASDAVPDLTNLLNDPELRNPAAIALVRLGAPGGDEVVAEMLRSDVLDMRLYAADAYDHSKPGPWVDAMMPLLRDPNGLTKIRAAEVLRIVAPEAANQVLREAAQDPNPVVRADVSRVLDSGFNQPANPAVSPAESIATLRRLLRDPDPSVRIHAAGALLQFTTGR